VIAGRVVPGEPVDPAVPAAVGAEVDAPADVVVGRVAVSSSDEQPAGRANATAARGRISRVRRVTAG
jgi:hypothetical protein